MELPEQRLVKPTESLVGLLSHSRPLSQYYLKCGIVDYFNIFPTNTAACAVDFEFAYRPTHEILLVSGLPSAATLNTESATSWKRWRYRVSHKCQYSLTSLRAGVTKNTEIYTFRDTCSSVLVQEKNIVLGKNVLEMDCGSKTNTRLALIYLTLLLYWPCTAHGLA